MNATPNMMSDRRPRGRARPATLLVLEQLEERCLLTAPQILLSPIVLANLRQEAANNSPGWLAFKARLDANLDVVIADNTGSYEGSQLAWIDDYALGYQALKNSDPLTADNYADKAIGLMKSGLDDNQRGSWVARQFLARGNGTTRAFTLPNADLVPSTLTVYLADVDTQAVVHQSASGQDTVGEDLIFLNVSTTPDGPANYAEGTDWTHNPNYPNSEIDWSTAAQQPPVGATYYVTYTSGQNANATSAYTLNGDTITFAQAPAKNQAVFVQYIYGTHSANGSTLAYQQTSAGDGGFNSVFIDDGYSYRYLGSSEAIGLDWLDGYVGMTPNFESQVETMLARWSEYVQANGYLSSSGSSNYGISDYESEVLTALALAPRDSTDGTGLLQAALAWRQDNLLPMLENPTTSLAGGFWAEGWNYGTAAVQRLLIAADALQTAGLITATPERQWADQVVDSLVEEESSPGLTYDGGEDYQYPFHFLDKSLFYVLSQMCASPTEQSYANYVIQEYPDSDFGEATPADFEQLLFDNPSAPASFWSALPLGYFASGTGLVTARSDWGSDPTWVATQIGNLLPNTDHQFDPGQLEIDRGADQLLINAFQVYYVYSDDALTPIQVSSLGNLVVVNDPTDERYPPNMGAWFGTPGVVDTAYENTDAYTYFDGDYAAAYSPEDDPGSSGQVSQLTRQVVFVRPGFVFVYDRAATTSASDDKILRWHFQNAPTVQGDSFVETVGSSRLFGQMYSTAPISTSLSSFTEGDAPFAIQQLDTENTTPTASVNYVTAFQVAGSTTTTMDPSEHILSSNSIMEGAEIENQVVLFGRNGPVAAGATIAYTFNGNSAVQHLLVDLSPSQTYQVIYDGLSHLIAASNQGTLSFSTPAGVSSVQVVAGNRASTTTSVVSASSSNPHSPHYGQSLTFTVTVSNASGGSTPTGTVTFYNGSTALGTRSLFGGTAGLTIATLPVGTDQLTATYNGSAEFSSSSSPSALAQSISADATSTSAVRPAPGNANPSTYGQPLTFTATVTNTSGTGAVPSGLVAFHNGSTSLGSRSLFGGTATLTVSTLYAGTYSITATYAGTVNFTGSASPSSSAVSQTVNKAGTRTTVTASPSPASPGQTVTLTATVANTSGTGAMPTGTVTFKGVVSGITTTLGTRSLVNGVATLTTSTLPAGSETIEAFFNLTTDFLGSSGNIFETIT